MQDCCSCSFFLYCIYTNPKRSSNTVSRIVSPHDSIHNNVTYNALLLYIATYHSHSLGITVAVEYHLLPWSLDIQFTLMQKLGCIIYTHAVSLILLTAWIIPVRTLDLVVINLITDLLEHYYKGMALQYILYSDLRPQSRWKSRDNHWNSGWSKVKLPSGWTRANLAFYVEYGYCTS